MTSGSGTHRDPRISKLSTESGHTGCPAIFDQELAATASGINPRDFFDLSFVMQRYGDGLHDDQCVDGKPKIFSRPVSGTLTGSSPSSALPRPPPSPWRPSCASSAPAPPCTPSPGACKSSRTSTATPPIAVPQPLRRHLLALRRPQPLPRSLLSGRPRPPVRLLRPPAPAPRPVPRAHQPALLGPHAPCPPDAIAAIERDLVLALTREFGLDLH